MWTRCLLTLALVSTGFAAFAQESKEPDAAKNAETDRAALEQKFSDQMKNSVLVGYFTVDGKSRDLKEERYEIGSDGIGQRLDSRRLGADHLACKIANRCVHAGALPGMKNASLMNDNDA